jgi:tetratricopeptide (TPR) repeat protein
MPAETCVRDEEIRAMTFMSKMHHTSIFLRLILIAIGLAAQPASCRVTGLQITALSPSSAVTSPGTAVEVFGTGFSPDALVYFDGLEARSTRFLSSSALQAVTPYLRPGTYQVQVRSGGTILRSELNFTAIPSPVDSDIDRATTLAAEGRSSEAITLLTSIATSDPDYQVHAFAHYQMAQIYFNQGDWWRSAGEAGQIFNDADKSGTAVQTSWRYRLIFDQTAYLLHANIHQPDYDLKQADFLVAFDVTQNPEPRFFRALVNARYGKLTKAMGDAAFILKIDPSNASYRALKAYIAVLGGDSTPLQAFQGGDISDPRALSLLGEAAYLSGDVAAAQRWWMRAAQADSRAASLAFLAGKKHAARGHQRIAEALLKACTEMAPNSKDSKEAAGLLATLASPKIP